ncbi:hypothetical protein [Pseudoduganella namucuonensis]|nr:hypothetical protein [Pseudoduganella namucuonensis]
MTVLAGMPGGSGNADGVTGRLFDPLALAIGPDGVLYASASAVTGNWGATVRRIAPGADGTMVVSTRWRGTGSEAHRALAADASGNLYGIAGNRIVRIGADGVETLVAGSESTEGWSGSGDGTGAQARFVMPTALAVDGAGLVYVADLNRIRTVTPAGEVRTHVAASNALFDQYGELYGKPMGVVRSVSGLAFDGAGNLVIAVADPDAFVRKVTPAGVRVDTKLKAISAVAADRGGNLYGFTQCALYKEDTAGVVSLLAGANTRRGAVDGAGGVASFGLADSDACDARLAADGSGNVYVTDQANSVVRKVTPAGMVSTVAGKTPSPGLVDGAGAAARFQRDAQDLTYDGKDSLYLVQGDKVRKVTRAGMVTTLKLPQKDASQNTMRYFAGGMAHQGSLIGVAGRVVYVVDENGGMRVLAGSSSVAGKTDGTGVQAGFDTVCGVTRDGGGNLYLLDCYAQHSDPNGFPDGFENRIRKVTPGGVVTTMYVAPKDDGTRQPWSLVADRQGNLFASTNNNAVLKFSSTGSVSTMAVDQKYYGWMAVDAQGNLFLANANLPPTQVQMIGPSGQAQIVAGRNDQFGLIPSPMPGSLGLLGGMTIDERGALYVLTENSVVSIVR